MTRSSAGLVMREIQTGLHKPESATKQRFTKSAENSAPICFPNCASICLGSRVSFDLPLALARCQFVFSSKNDELTPNFQKVPFVRPRFGFANCNL